MKRIETLIISLSSILFACFAPSLSAQEAPEGYQYADSLVYTPVSAVDSTLSGRDIFHLMPSKAAGDDTDVNIRQSQSIINSVRSYITSNEKRTVSGYRVRIFFDNKQTARSESEATLKRFRSLFPDVMAYRIYANPYFKVTVGDFRTKSEAMALLGQIKGAFPSAFVVRENIGYPVVDRENAVIVDTVKVLRPIQ